MVGIQSRLAFILTSLLMPELNLLPEALTAVNLWQHSTKADCHSHLPVLLVALQQLQPVPACA